MLLLIFRDVMYRVEDFIWPLRLPGAVLGTIFSLVFPLLSVCEPAATWLLTTAKSRRADAAPRTSEGFRRAAMIIAVAYCAGRILTGILRSGLSIRTAGGFFFSNFTIRIIQSVDVLNSLTLISLHIAAWIYFADLATRLRRGIYLTSATLLLGVGLVVTVAIFILRIETRWEGLISPVWYSIASSLSSDTYLCWAHLTFWSMAAWHLHRDASRGAKV
jgi:hypothetical protein